MEVLASVLVRVVVDLGLGARAAGHNQRAVGVEDVQMEEAAGASSADLRVVVK